MDKTFYSLLQYDEISILFPHNLESKLIFVFNDFLYSENTPIGNILILHYW